MVARFVRHMCLTLLALALSHSGSALAEASDKFWPIMKESFFAGKTVNEADFIKLDGPKRAESGAQVPITLSIDKPLTDKDAIRKVYILVDANPIQLAAIYNFTPLNGKAEIETRIRLETDSYVRAIGETADGRLFMSATEIRASGGCGGPLEVDMAEVRATSGKIKMNLPETFKAGEINSVVFRIKHPMMTGLQRDLATGGYWPAFFINQVTFTYNGAPLMTADLGVGTSEDPYLKFNFVPKQAGTIEVKASDNEGRNFSYEAPVNL